MNFPQVHHFFQEAIQTVLSRTTNSTLTSLAGASGAFFTSLLGKKAPNPILIVTDTFDSGERLVQELEFFLGKGSVDFFPHWDTFPYDNLSPDKNVVALRLKTLFRILHQKAKFIVTTPMSLMLKVMPPQVLLAHSFVLNIGDILPREQILRKMMDLGYVRVDLVEEKGEYAVRGEIIDLFPLSENHPVRLDFFDDELETIKYFDIETQSSQEAIDEILLLPSHEVICSKEFMDNAIYELQKLKASISPQVYQNTLEQLKSGASFLGMESFLPLFFKETASLLDFFPTKPMILFEEEEQVKKRAEAHFQEIAAEYKLALGQGTVCLTPDNIYFSPAELFAEMAQFQSIDLQPFYFEDTHQGIQFPVTDNAAIYAVSLTTEKTVQSNAHNVLTQLQQWHSQGVGIDIAVQTLTEGERLKQRLAEMEFFVSVEESIDSNTGYLDFLENQTNKEYRALARIFVGNLARGFRCFDQQGETQYVLITEEEIFGAKQKQHRLPKSNIKQFINSLANLNVGDYVVHVEYGIGKYEGLKKISAGEFETDFLEISYSGGDKVYVPVEKFNLVQKYSGVEESKPRLNKLGEKSWSKTKSKVRAEVAEMAEELVKIYAERAARKGITFSPDNALMNEFAMAFPFRETEDQEKSIENVLRDMEKSTPMDRLVCGDVGFGKTEVAMRAAFKAVLDGYQVAVLVPTTILAQQHYNSFSTRFAEFSTHIGLLSRFQTPKEVKTTLENLSQGKLDIVIGTHRLLSKDVVFQKLGLFIVDEEQRFGVTHKEKIKKYRALVDVLTLSATPIPRTLHMSLMGIRDLSIINTPPMDRRAVRTRIMKFSDYIIQEAVSREMRRKGQVFFIHNSVETIFNMANYLKSILPKIRIGIAHGQMPERQLEKVMLEYYRGEYDLLVSTTIVESGLDVTRANTMIINNADKFGLSQLYQLRGRVGRGNVQAFAYLLVPQDKIITQIARKRLSVLQELSDLGSGFKIASHDLELRGAGNLLGSQQSGHIAAVGFEMYTSMIEDAVAAVKRGDKAMETTAETIKKEEIKIKLGFEAFIPESFISSENQRLDTYKSISGVSDENELWKLRELLEDRFGKLPDSVLNLFYGMFIRLQCREMNIVQLDSSRYGLDVVFHESFQPDPMKMIQLMQTYVPPLKLLPNSRIRIESPPLKPEEIYSELRRLSKELFETNETLEV